ncbi:hypothetical protein BLS_000104 [Venturia inaequalis]|nr:hypothetical protein BLS_000104 [Venturia inaequalis]RDI88462.1 hypothetical protein Vi05172_g1471 [Venturia inaequalis]
MASLRLCVKLVQGASELVAFELYTGQVLPQGPSHLLALPNELKSAIANMLLEGPDEDLLWSDTGAQIIHHDEFRTRSEKFEDLLSFRLANRELNESTWQILGEMFREVTIGLERNSLKALVSLSENPTYSQYIQSINIHFSYYSEELMEDYACYYSETLGHSQWWLDPERDGPEHYNNYDIHLRSLFDFDNRKQEREQMEKSKEDEALLAEALQGLPACDRISFNWEKSAADYLDPKEADKAITLGEKLNGPRFPIVEECIDEYGTNFFGWWELQWPGHDMGGVKTGCREAIVRTVEMVSRALASAGKRGVDAGTVEKFIHETDPAFHWL